MVAARDPPHINLEVAEEMTVMSALAAKVGRATASEEGCRTPLA